MYSFPSSALYKSVTARAFMVIPRSFSNSILSSSCADISLIETDSVSSKILSASVDFPWSICAIMLKFLICSRGNDNIPHLKNNSIKIFICALGFERP